MSKNTTDLRDEVAMWVETAVHKFHASDGVVIMNDVVEESVAEIVTLISDRERLLLDRVEKHFEADGQASHAYVREYLATLRKELSGKEQTDE